MLKYWRSCPGGQVLSVTGAPAARPYDRASVGVRYWNRRPTGGRMLAGCPGTRHRHASHAPVPVLDPAGRRPTAGQTKQEEALDMDVENILAKVAENLS